MTEVSIVVPVHGQAAVTKQCVDGLLGSLEPEVEIVVVNDGSPDDTSELLKGYGDRLTTVEHEDPKGFAAACNAGARAATGALVVFLNNDTVPTRGWLKALVDYVEAHPAAAAVGARLLTQDGSVQHAGLVVCHDLIPRHVYRGFPSEHPAVMRSRPFQAVTGACLLVRRDAFEEAGGFDEAFRNGFEDVDLCLRLREQGHGIHYCHESVLVHLEAATRGEHAEEFARNAKEFLDRWGDKLVPDDLSVYVEDGLISIAYTDLYPFPMRISPELAAVGAEGVLERAFELLGERSRQIFDLLKENTVLRARLGEIELEEARESVAAEASEVEAFGIGGVERQ